MNRPVIIVLMLLASAAHGDSSHKSVRTQHITFIAPSSMDELWDDADVVAHIRVLGSRPELRPGSAEGGTKHVFTAHRMRVLDVFKTDVSMDCASLASEVAECSPRVGDELPLLQRAGEVETEDEIIRLADEVPLASGADYVVFLKWNAHLGVFTPLFGPHGTFEVRKGVVHPASKWRVSAEHQGKPASKFVDELRRKGRKP